jgi:hypothetical protein
MGGRSRRQSVISAAGPALEEPSQGIGGAAMTHRQRSDAQLRAGGHLPGMSIRVAVVVGRRNRSASGPRPQRCT